MVGSSIVKGQLTALDVVVYPTHLHTARIHLRVPSDLFNRSTECREVYAFFPTSGSGTSVSAPRVALAPWHLPVA